MSQSKYIFIVSMNVKSEFENLFNEVYDKEHIPYLLEVPGVNKVTRGKGMPFFFSIGGETKSMDAPSQKFVAMYEIESPDVVNSSEWSVHLAHQLLSKCVFSRGTSVRISLDGIQSDSSISELDGIQSGMLFREDALRNCACHGPNTE